MSFGASGSYRFETGNARGKPVIFWEQNDSQKRTKKKFGYKKKNLKIPLRSLKQESEEPPQAKSLPPDTENKINKNISAVSGNNKHQKQNIGKKPSKSKVDDKRKPQSDTVTLTQGQFDKILETIGELTILADEKENKGLDLNTNNSTNYGVTDVINGGSKSNSSHPVATGTNQIQSPVPFTQQQTNIIPQQQYQQQQSAAPPATNSSNVPKLDVTSPRHYDPRSVPTGPVTGDTRSSLLGVPKAFLTKAERKRLEWERQRAEDEAIRQQVRHTMDLHKVGGVPGAANQPQSPATAQPPASFQPAVLQAPSQTVPVAPAAAPMVTVTAGNVAPVPVLNAARPQPQNTSKPVTFSHEPVQSSAPLTKAQLKRLQWEKERADIAKAKDYDPWGRPGAGAPVRGSDGQLLNDYHTRQNDLIRQSFEQNTPRQQQYQQQAPQQAAYQQVGAAAPVAVVQQPPGAYSAAGAGQLSAAAAAEAPPAAIRSSFNVGAVAPDENKYQSAKERQRQQWLADLERQREDDRLRKQLQVQKTLELDRSDQPVSSNYTAAGPPGPAPAVQQTPQQQVPAHHQQQYPASYTQQQQPVAAAGAEQQSEDDNRPDTFIRGQNVYIDPHTRKELEEKRRKQIEYQEYIKQQIGERENKKKIERERKWKEEIEEEQKLQKERDEIQAQLDKEQGKFRKKQVLPSK